MSDKRSGERVREILNGFLEKVFAEEQDIEVLAISTLDGLNISHVAADHVVIAAPHLANVAGSVLGLGKDLTQSTLGKDPGTVCLETDAGNVCLAHTTFANHPCILTIAGNRDLSLARIRLTTVRLAEQIASFGRQSTSTASAVDAHADQPAAAGAN